MRPTKEVALSLLFAFCAMVFVFLMILFIPPPSAAVPMKDKLIVSAFFIASCCIGISFGLYPGWIRRRMNTDDVKTEMMKSKNVRSFSGHHPDCDTFQAHRLTIGNKTWCAGCLGLLLGASVSIILMVLYVASSPGFSRSFYVLLLLFGLILVVAIYLKTVTRNRHPLFHLFFNATLIPGFFFITMSVIELTGKGDLGVFTILLCAVFLNTRVSLSTWRHRSTCNHCTEVCKMYSRASA